jgi:hypothetical protein
MKNEEKEEIDDLVELSIAGELNPTTTVCAIKS